jgi:hypothetical protein
VGETIIHPDALISSSLIPMREKNKKQKHNNKQTNKQNKNNKHNTKTHVQLLRRAVGHNVPLLPRGVLAALRSCGGSAGGGGVGDGGGGGGGGGGSYFHDLELPHRRWFLLGLRGGRARVVRSDA